MTFEEDGKEITRVRTVLVFNVREEELHCRGIVTVALVERHDPAVEDVVVELARHLQAVHPGVLTAEEEQQHPERHRLVAQSKLVLQGRPGEYMTHSPHEVQLEQPRRRAEASHVVVDTLEELTPPR